MLLEAISNTRKSASSGIQILNPLLSVWISDETLFHVFYMLLEWPASFLNFAQNGIGLECGVKFVGQSQDGVRQLNNSTFQ